MFTRRTGTAGWVGAALGRGCDLQLKQQERGEKLLIFARHLAGPALAATLAAGAASAHPLDGLTAEEYLKINEILRAAGTVTTRRSIR